MRKKRLSIHAKERAIQPQLTALGMPSSAATIGDTRASEKRAKRSSTETPLTGILRKDAKDSQVSAGSSAKNPPDSAGAPDGGFIPVGRKHEVKYDSGAVKFPPMAYAV